MDELRLRAQSAEHSTESELRAAGDAAIAQRMNALTTETVTFMSEEAATAANRSLSMERAMGQELEMVRSGAEAAYQQSRRLEACEENAQDYVVHLRADADAAVASWRAMCERGQAELAASRLETEDLRRAVESLEARLVAAPVQVAAPAPSAPERTTRARRAGVPEAPLPVAPPAKKPTGVVGAGHLPVPSGNPVSAAPTWGTSGGNPHVSFRVAGGSGGGPPGGPAGGTGNPGKSPAPPPTVPSKPSVSRGAKVKSGGGGGGGDSDDEGDDDDGDDGDWPEDEDGDEGEDEEEEEEEEFDPDAEVDPDAAAQDVAPASRAEERSDLALARARLAYQEALDRSRRDRLGKNNKGGRTRDPDEIIIDAVPGAAGFINTLAVL